ncbi:uncharacterized protein K452DRAFT_94338 [Aplosporella prunicola CBS 121167]|uniref:Uncharacterized protein n=1 Tax=Aplosporella prunicola CBS 121167 TaxID=1176127 RepID=A0A6A6B5J8_9PEZI|nr:uncharacterized protein K452DRAFT_94338 [Aplosporella prunicola CBS 121167]KAF2138041.1 hypothetical protein K452DRAFT_94338 [Aplosporella prunicola CBS 121167]
MIGDEITKPNRGSRHHPQHHAVYCYAFIIEVGVLNITTIHPKAPKFSLQVLRFMTANL